MSTNPNEEKKVPETPIFDPFPKPVTMPDGWNLDVLVSDSEPVSASSTDGSDDTSTA